MTISRDEVENILKSVKVVSSITVQDGGELKVHLTLSDNSTCIVIYDRKNQQKSYFLKPAE